MLAPPGAPPTPDASAAQKGKIKLAGDLTGTAAAPTLITVTTAGIVGSSTAIPVLTIDANGRVTSATTATPVAPTASRSFAFFAS